MLECEPAPIGPDFSSFSPDRLQYSPSKEGANDDPKEGTANPKNVDEEAIIKTPQFQAPGAIFPPFQFNLFIFVR